MKHDSLIKLFRSRDPNDLFEFYNHFRNKEELFEWMKNRPPPKMKFMEVNGATDVIVVIPTPTAKNKFVQNCKELFKGLHIIFVVSSGENFNFARCNNTGICLALRYNPRWIIMSNDDMIGVDPIYKLTDILSKIDNRKVDCLVPDTLNNTFRVYEPRVLIKFFRSYYNLLHKFDINRVILDESGGKIRRFVVKVFLYKPVTDRFRNVADLYVLSGEYARKKNGLVYDTTFINDSEDIKLSFEVKKRLRIVKFKISRYKSGGAHFTRDFSRTLRAVAGLSYLNFIQKW